MEALKMETPMENWNDDRLDEMSRRMDEGFKQVNADMKEGFADLRGEMREGFARMDKRFEQVDKRFERLYYTLITASFGMVVSVVLAVTFG
jgi:archaellum component FlaC